MYLNIKLILFFVSVTQSFSFLFNNDKNRTFTMPYEVLTELDRSPLILLATLCQGHCASVIKVLLFFTHGKFVPTSSVTCLLFIHFLNKLFFQIMRKIESMFHILLTKILPRKCMVLRK